MDRIHVIPVALMLASVSARAELKIADPAEAKPPAAAPATAPATGPAEAPAETPAARLPWIVGARGSLALQAPQAPFSGESSRLAPPVFELLLGYHPGPSGLRVDANFSVLQSSLPAVIGVRPGYSLEHGRFGLDLALDLQDQKLIDRSEYANLPFNTFVTAAVARLRYRASDSAELGLQVRGWEQSDASLSSFESLTTEVGHGDSASITPSVALALPAGTRLALSADFYFLGAAAIASREFTFAIPRQDSIKRFSAEAGIRLGQNWETTARYSFVTGVRDPIELLYQAPYLTENYLLSRHVLALGVTSRW